jgi:hypothetical protein
VSDEIVAHIGAEPTTGDLLPQQCASCGVWIDGVCSRCGLPVRERTPEEVQDYARAREARERAGLAW